MVVVLFGTFCCSLIGLREIFVKVTNVPTYALVIQIYFGLMGAGVGCGFGLLLVFFGEEGAKSWEKMCLIENIVNKGN